MAVTKTMPVASPGRARRFAGQHRLFLAVLGAGLVVRIVLIALEPHGATYFFDGLTYLLIDPFLDPRFPGGYQLFVQGLHAIAPSLTLLVAVQHLLGLAAAVALYAAGRAAGLARPFAAAATLPVLFAGEAILLEHAPLTDPLSAVLLDFGIALLVLGVHDRRWALPAAGAILGLSATVRSIGIPVTIACAAWLVVAIPGRPLRRLTAVLIFATGFACVLGGYLAIASSGPYSGLGDVSGGYLYARVAPFADCRFFTPPPRTRGLCESSPPASRPGPVFYQGQPGAPKLRVFPATQTELAAADSELGAFARAAILGEPKAYLRTVVDDYIRYFENDPVVRPWHGSSWDVLTLGVTWTAQKEVVAARIRAKYPDVSTAPPHAEGLLLVYSSVTQVRGGVLLALVALGVLGLALGSPRRRIAALGLLVFVVLTLVPVATITYSQRYAVPSYGALGLAAAVGLQALFERVRRRALATIPS